MSTPVTKMVASMIEVPHSSLVNVSMSLFSFIIVIFCTLMAYKRSLES